MPRPWPLHPRPEEAERLGDYLRRLARTYGVGYEALRRHLRGGDRAGLGRPGRLPKPAVLERLAALTRVPLAQLDEMALGQARPGTMEEVERLVALPAFRATLLRACGQEASED